MNVKKKIGIGLLLIYAFSVALFLPTLTNASAPTITAIVNPFTGNQFSWGRELDVLEATYPISYINLTYEVPTTVTIPLIITNSYINGYNYTTPKYANYSKTYDIQTSYLQPGKTYSLTSEFKATTTENTTEISVSPYNVYGYTEFNTTPATPFFYSYKTDDTLNGTIYSAYANISATFSAIPFYVYDLSFNTTNLRVTAIVTPNLPIIENTISINFTVVLSAVHYMNYTITANFYKDETFINSLTDVVTNVPSPVSEESPVPVSFTTPPTIGYVSLVDFGLWSNTSTVYVSGVSNYTYPGNAKVISSNNASFRPVIIPPSMTINYQMFGYGNLGMMSQLYPNVTDNYMVANISIYAPDDMLNWFVANPYNSQHFNVTNAQWNAFAPINEPSTNGYWDMAGRGLNVSLFIGGKPVATANVPLQLAAIGNSYDNFRYIAHLSFLLSSVNNVNNVSVYPASADSSVVYVIINPSELSKATLYVSYNDSDYAVQYIFSLYHLNIINYTSDISIYTPTIQLPSVVNITTALIHGNVTDYDYGYHYVYSNESAYNYTLLNPSGASELVLGVNPSNQKEATVSIYYPNTPLYYPTSHQVQVGVIKSITLNFSNGTTDIIYLTPNNITSLFTTYTWYQDGNYPLALWQYGFEISIGGLEHILNINSTVAPVVLNKSLLTINYYDNVSQKTTSASVELLSTQISLNLTPSNKGIVPMAIGTPIQDLQPGVKIIYNITATNEFNITVEYSNPNLASTSPGQILSVPIENISVLGYTGMKAYNDNVSEIKVLTETAPDSGIFVGTVQFTMAEGTPINTTTLYLDGKPIGYVSDYINIQKSMEVKVEVSGITATVNFTGEPYTNLFYNSTPLVYNPVNDQLSFNLGAKIPYNYAGYIAISIYNGSGYSVYAYETFFQPLPNTTDHDLIAFDLTLAHLKPGTYTVNVSVFTIPVPRAAIVELDVVTTTLNIS